MPTVLSANRSNVTITVEGQEPKAIEGLQAIRYKSSQEREDVPVIGSDQRIDVVFGLKIVKGSLSVKSTDTMLNETLQNGTQFQLVVSLKARGEDGAVQRVTFDQCYLDDKDFSIDVNGVGATTYFFNATNVREEMA